MEAKKYIVLGILFIGLIIWLIVLQVKLNDLSNTQLMKAVSTTNITNECVSTQDLSKSSENLKILISSHGQVQHNLLSYLNVFLTVLSPLYLVGENGNFQYSGSSQDVIKNFHFDSTKTDEINLNITNIRKLGTDILRVDSWKRSVDFESDSLIGKTMNLKDVQGGTGHVIIDNFEFHGESYVVSKPSYNSDSFYMQVPSETLVTLTGNPFYPLKTTFDPQSYRIYTGSHVELHIFSKENPDVTLIDLDNLMYSVQKCTRNNKHNYVRFSGNKNDVVLPFHQMYKNENNVFCLKFPLDVQLQLKMVVDSSVSSPNAPITIRYSDELLEIGRWSLTLVSEFTLKSFELDRYSGVQYFTLELTDTDQAHLLLLNNLVGLQVKVTNIRGSRFFTILEYVQVSQKWQLGGRILVDNKELPETLQFYEAKPF